MRFAFNKVRLETESLLSIIETWAEMQLFVTKDETYITGFGFPDDIGGAFTTLVFDWEAFIYLPQHKLNLEEGAYDILTIGEELYAFRNQKKYFIGDGPVVVELISVPED
jgi:hypothetical protein